jgi:hypothetical protein
MYFQSQPVVSCFFPRAYVPRQVPDNGRWWNGLCENEKYTYEFQLEATAAQTFRPERITQCLFGGGVENCYQTLCISGSQTTARGGKTVVLKEHHREQGSCHAPLAQRAPFSVDWLADYFWLPPDYVSELRFKPTINTYRITPSLHTEYMINECTHIKADLYLPVEHATWNMHVEERKRTVSEHGYDAGYVRADTVELTQLMPNARSSFAGCAPQLETIIIDPLKSAKISPCPLNKTALNCAYLMFGVYTTPAPWVYYGFGGIISTPAGTRPTGEYLFEALVGDGRYLRYGLEAYAQFHLFYDAKRKAWGLLTFDSTLTSCAKSCQHRTFDLCGKPNSRYCLIHQPDALVPHYSYLANLSTLEVEAHIKALFEISVMLTYAVERTNWSFGYRFWARTDDHLNIIHPQLFPEQTWALKGDAHVYGFAIQPGSDPAGTARYIRASERKATVESGTNMPSQGSTDPVVIAAARKNPRVDNPVPAITGTGQPLAASPDDLTLVNQTRSSEPPLYLSIGDLNIKSACSTGMLHTVFTIMDTKLTDGSRGHTLHLYVRGEIDFGKASTAIPPACFNQCVNIAPSQWEVALGLYVDF